MDWGSIIGGGFAAAGSLIGANQQSTASKRAAEMSMAQYYQNNNMLKQYRDTGEQANAALATGMGLGPNTGQAGYGDLMKPFGMDQFQQSPAYQFNLQQGQQAIDKGAAARGNYYAPQTLQDLGKFQQGMASNEFQNAFSNYNTSQGNAFNRLFGVSGSGQNAATQTGSFGQNAANFGGMAQIGAGDARSAGTVGAFNNLGGGIGDAYNNYLQQQIISRMQQPTYGMQQGGNYGNQG